MEQEREELNRIINKGVSFSVEDTRVVYKPFLCGLFKKKTLVRQTLTFVIEEPTLGTLDRLSAQWVEMAVDLEALKEKDALAQAKQMVHKHALRCARVVALAVLGSDYLVARAGRAGVVKYVPDEKRLEELTSLFARELKPSELAGLCLLIDAMCNFGDFINSIRLMSSGRTTTPIRVE